MPGFNTSAKKEDVSLKLRAQNLRHARDQTKRLEEDNRKMEERLKELKMVMMREKEQRERQGAGFWVKGQPNTGSLTGYASEVLQNKPVIPPAEGKIKRIKVLRDEPIDKPKQIGPPGTMKYIAQRKLVTGATPRDKQKGPKCGQCEDRTATLSCVQCSEIYCPGCFAAFHLKGALKQHRSVSLSAAGPRVCMSPSTSADSQSPRGGQASGSGQASVSGQASGSIPIQSCSNMNGSEAAGASSALLSGHTPSSTATSLLQGNYDESQSAESFQAALMAWRQGTPPKSNQSEKIAAVDESTGTSEEINSAEPTFTSTVPDIKFTSTLTYAEKLMVKGHLRMKLAEASPEPCIQVQSGINAVRQSAISSEEGRPISQSHSSGFFTRGKSVADSRKTVRSRSTDFSTDMETRRSLSLDGDDEHIDFQSLFEAVTLSPTRKSVTLSDSPNRNAVRSAPGRSDISIGELFPEQPLALERQNEAASASCVIKEVSPLESWRTQHLKQSDNSVAPFVAGNHSRLKSLNPQFQHQADMKTQLEMWNHDKKLPVVTSHVASTHSQHQNLESYPTISEIPSDENVLLSKPEVGTQKFKPVECQGVEDNCHLECDQSPPRLESKASKPQSRPMSAKSQPRTARSKLSKCSRVFSRAGVEGNLTKAPSDALKSIAQRVQSSEHFYTSHSPLESFFLAGVEEKQPTQTEDRFMTPTKERNKTPRSESRSEINKSVRKEVAKISNRLYQMAPKSWRPNSSLSSAVELADVNYCDQVTLSFSYGKQMSGQEFDWSSSSCQNMQETPGRSEPACMFGDEMFVTEAAAAAPTSQVVSFQRSSERTECDHVQNSRQNCEASETLTCQTPVKSSGRRFHNITSTRNDASSSDNNATGNSCDIIKGMKRVPVPPDSRHNERLSQNLDSSVSASSNQNNIRFKPLKEITDKTRALKDNKNINPSRNSSISPNFLGSLKTSLQSESNKSKPGQSQKADASSSLPDEIQTVSQKNKKAKTPNHLRRNFEKVMSQCQSDQTLNKRPNSSTNLPEHFDIEKLTSLVGILRPSSSSAGGSAAVRKTQQSQKSGTDTVVCDMMKSRVVEDGWVDDVSDISYDYDDGDNLTPRCLKAQLIKRVPEMTNKSSDIWQTDIRPFSGLSTGSQTSSSRARRASSSRKECKQTSRPVSGHSTMSQRSGRISRAIVVDGDDLSCYDSIGAPEEQDKEDKQALDQLEWELASNAGRLTSDGKISLASVPDHQDTDSSLSKGRSLKISLERDYDIAAKLLEDEKQAERKVENLERRRNMAHTEVAEVRALR